MGGLFISDAKGGGGFAPRPVAPLKSRRRIDPLTGTAGADGDVRYAQSGPAAGDEYRF